MTLSRIAMDCPGTFDGWLTDHTIGQTRGPSHGTQGVQGPRVKDRGKVSPSPGVLDRGSPRTIPGCPSRSPRQSLGVPPKVSLSPGVQDRGSPRTIPGFPYEGIAKSWGSGVTNLCAQRQLGKCGNEPARYLTSCVCVWGGGGGGGGTCL